MKLPGIFSHSPSQVQTASRRWAYATRQRGIGFEPNRPSCAEIRNFSFRNPLELDAVEFFHAAVPHDSEKFVPFAQQKLREIGPVLPGNARNQCTHRFSFCLRPDNPLSLPPGGHGDPKGSSPSASTSTATDRRIKSREMTNRLPFFFFTRVPSRPASGPALIRTRRPTVR